MDAKTRQIFDRYFTAKGTVDVLQQSATRRHPRRHISVSCFAESTRQITPSIVYGNKKLSYCCESRSYWLQKYDRLKQLLRDTLSVLTPYSCFHFRLDDQTNHTQPTSRRRAPAKRYSSPPTPPYFYVRFHRDEQTNHAQPTSLGKRGF